VVVEFAAYARLLDKENELRFKSHNDAPDLQTQFESLLDQVWQSESDWRLWDRVDAAVMLESIRERRAAANRETKTPT
jgi:hypothetical protein